MVSIDKKLEARFNELFPVPDNTAFVRPAIVESFCVEEQRRMLDQYTEQVSFLREHGVDLFGEPFLIDPRHSHTLDQAKHFVPFFGDRKLRRTYTKYIELNEVKPGGIGLVFPKELEELGVHLPDPLIPDVPGIVAEYKVIMSVLVYHL